MQDTTGDSFSGVALWPHDIALLEQTSIELPNKRKTMENLFCLKNLALYIEDLEGKLNEYFDKYKIDTQARQKHLH